VLCRRSAKSLIDVIFGDQAIHEDIVVSDRYFFKQLAFEGECDQWGIEACVLQKLVVVAFAVAHAGTATIKGDSWNHNQIQFLYVDLLFGQAPQFDLWFENAVHAEFQFVHGSEAEQFQFASFIARVRTSLRTSM
jgi:hypothetical protein